MSAASPRGGLRPARTKRRTNQPVRATAATTAPSDAKPLIDRGSTALANTSGCAVDQPSTRCAWSTLTSTALLSDVRKGSDECAAWASDRSSAEWPRMASTPTTAAMAMKDRKRDRPHAPFSLTMRGDAKPGIRRRTPVRASMYPIPPQGSYTVLSCRGIGRPPAELGERFSQWPGVRPG